MSGHILCEFCNKQASYNELNSHGVKWCINHRTSTSVNKKVRICYMEGCTTQASYNIATKYTGHSCVTHKLEGYVMVTAKMCEFPGCRKQPTYGKEIGHAKYCFIHCDEDDTNVKTRKCIEDGCNIHPSYGFKDGKNTRIHCVYHKSKEEVLLKSCCQGTNCSSQATYSFLNARGPTHCTSCKLPEMITRAKRKHILRENVIDEEKQERFKRAREFLVMFSEEQKL